MPNTFVALLLLVNPPSPPSHIDQGDQEFARMNYAQAEVFYDSALSTSTDSADALWRLARVNVCMGDVAPRGERLDFYREAEVYAVRCIRADSSRSEGYTWRAAALGNIAMFEGSKTKVRLCQEIKRDLDISLSLHPDDDIAYSILGSFYMALGNVGWIERQLAAVFLGSLPDGGYEESERAFKKAIALGPGVIRHRFGLGELYMLQDRTEEALEQFRKVVELPVLLARDRRAQSEAAGLIRDLAEE